MAAGCAAEGANAVFPFMVTYKFTYGTAAVFPGMLCLVRIKIKVLFAESALLSVFLQGFFGVRNQIFFMISKIREKTQFTDSHIDTGCLLIKVVFGKFGIFTAGTIAAMILMD